MKDPKVSIIIPVFNTEDYLGYAIESIINQTLTDIEIIIINDGSTDNSLDVIQKFAQKDSRIKVYCQENRGLSLTRNKGIDNANGEFIYFMDSDDLLEPDALELCYNKCINEQLDFVFFDAENIYESAFKNKHWQSYQRTDNLTQKIYTGIEIFNIQIAKHQFRSSVCLNVIRTEFIKQNNLYFFPNIIHEDQLFSSLLYLLASKVSFINRTFFKRRIRDNSIMTAQFNWKNLDGYFCVTDELTKFAKGKDVNIQSTVAAFLTQMLNAAIWTAQALPPQKRIKLYFLLIRKYRKYIKNKTLAVLLFRPLIRKNNTPKTDNKEK